MSTGAGAWARAQPGRAAAQLARGLKGRGLGGPRRLRESRSGGGARAFPGVRWDPCSRRGRSRRACRGRVPAAAVTGAFACAVFSLPTGTEEISGWESPAGAIVTNGTTGAVCRARSPAKGGAQCSRAPRRPFLGVGTPPRRFPVEAVLRTPPNPSPRWGCRQQGAPPRPPRLSEPQARPSSRRTFRTGSFSPRVERPHMTEG